MDYFRQIFSSAFYVNNLRSIDCATYLPSVVSEIKFIEDSIGSNSWEKTFEWMVKGNRIYVIYESLEFIIHCEKGQLKRLIPNLYHRNWLMASLRMSVNRLRYIDVLMREMVNSDTHNPDFYNLQNALKIALLHIEQARGILRAQELRKEIKENADSLLLDKKELKHGDVLVSYKTGRYLKKHFLSKLIAIVAKTNFTHSSMVCVDKNGEMSMLNCAAEDVEVKGVSIDKLKPRDGEVYLVLRTKENFNKMDDFIKSFNKWIEVAKKRTKKTKDENYFSELKCWTACIIGFIFTNTVFFGGVLVSIPNIFKKSKGLFCSEIIDVIFKEAGTVIMPRAEQDAILGPSDIVYSPYLEFKGILGDKSDIDLMKKEKILM